jgi:hypothetical protein
MIQLLILPEELEGIYPEGPQGDIDIREVAENKGLWADCLGHKTLKQFQEMFPDETYREVICAPE